MLQGIAETGLDLRGWKVLTEAATGAYAVTPVVAALAGASKVYAIGRSSAYGSIAKITEETMHLATLAGVVDRIVISEQLPTQSLREVDIVTNSGNLRPIDGRIIDSLPAGAVIALMFEAWEFRAQDIDIAACLRKRIPVVGVNERHPAVDVFSYLGPLAVKCLHDAGFPVYRNRIAVLCDNDFDEPIMRGLAGLGANALCVAAVEDLPQDSWDVILVALRPGPELRIGAHEVGCLRAASAPGTLIVQFWGDMDREALHAANFQVWPPSPPERGHMAILLSMLGPDAVVRLQIGGLRAAECLRRGGVINSDGFAQLLDLKTFVK